jgi:hypothetical protein
VAIAPASSALSGLVALGAAALGWRFCKQWLSQSSSSRWTWHFSVIINRWQIVGAAAAVAVIGFLSINSYHAGGGFVWNVIHARIYLTRPCVGPNFSDLGVPAGGARDFLERLWNGECGVFFPYSGLLAATVSVAAIALLWPRHKPNEPIAPSRMPSAPPPLPRGGPPPLPPLPSV